jgi:hypothetical protein
MSWYDSVEWSQPVRVSEYPDITRIGREDKLPEDKGAYRIIALANDDDFTTAPLIRVCGVDDTGTLYIGSADGNFGLGGRVGRAMVGSFHQVYKFSKPLADRFPTNRLAVVWCRHGASTRLEEQLVHAYEDAYGEFPPINRSISAPERPAPIAKG